MTVDADRPLEAWDRFNRVWHGLFAFTLGVPTLLAVVNGRPWIALPAAGFALWYYFVLIRHPQWWERPIPMTVYWGVAIAFIVILSDQHSAYLILFYSQFPLMFATLGWWAVVPIPVMTAVVGWRNEFWQDGIGAIFNVVMTTLLALLIGLAVHAIAAQSERRRDALRELEQTRAELAATSRHAGVLEERQRLAREIHDTLAQGLTSIVTQLEATERLFTDEPEQARRHLGIARQTAREGLSEVRRSVRDLRPDLLDGLSLADALDRACRSWSAKTGILAKLRTTGEPAPLHAETETALLRTVQEALANTAKHAQATRVTVTLSYLDDTVTLDIDDDGVGMDAGAGMGRGTGRGMGRGMAGAPRPSEHGGFGLAGMRERITAIGGQLHIESAAGSGTTIAVSVPA